MCTHLTTCSFGCVAYSRTRTDQVTWLYPCRLSLSLAVCCVSLSLLFILHGFPTCVATLHILRRNFVLLRAIPPPPPFIARSLRPYTIMNTPRPIDPSQYQFLQMLRFDRRSGNLAVTDLGRAASHFYISHESVFRFNDAMMPTLADAAAVNLVCLASEFDQVKVRQYTNEPVSCPFFFLLDVLTKKRRTTTVANEIDQVRAQRCTSESMPSSVSLLHLCFVHTVMKSERPTFTTGAADFDEVKATDSTSVAPQVYVS